MVRISGAGFSNCASRVSLVTLAFVVLGLSGSFVGCHQARPDQAVSGEGAVKVDESEQSEGSGVEQVEDEASPEVDKPDGRVGDSKGRFSVALPGGWETEELSDDWLKVLTPEEDLSVFVGVVTGLDAEAALAEPWSQWEEDFQVKEETKVEPPAEDGYERIVLITYQMEEPRLFAQAIGRHYEGDTYIFAVYGDMAAIEKRSAQLNIIQSSIAVDALEKPDLSGAEPGAFDAEKQKAFDAFVTRQFERSGIPGSAVAVVVGDEIVYKKGFGVRQKGADLPVEPSTLMMVGSTTKALTTSMMARLVDQEVMRWDSSVRELMPEFKLADEDATRRAQIQHMVCACTGVPRRDLELLFEFASVTPQKTVEAMQTFELLTDFGETFQYSNQMVAAGGYAAAMANGAGFDELQEGYDRALQTHVFEPLGMARTTVDFDRALKDSDHAMPHISLLDGRVEAMDIALERFVEPAAPAGAAWSSVEEMARFVSAQLAQGKTPDGAQWVSAENLAETQRGRVEVSSGVSYGLGWFVDNYKEVPVIHHGGNTHGFTAEVAFMPRANIGIVVLSNMASSNWFAAALKTRLWELIYGQDDEKAEKSATSYLERREERIAKKIESLEEVSREEILNFLGDYANSDLGSLRLEYREGELIADYGEGETILMRLVGESERFEASRGVINGLPFQLFETDGEPQIRVGLGASEYIFTPLQ